MLKKQTLNKLIFSFLIVVAGMLSVISPVFADEPDCESNYGGGETCLVNKRFKIEKKVRLEGDDDWQDRVTIDLTDDDENDKEIEFRIRIKNLSDDVADLSFDDMKMEDKLPGVFDKIGGSGLTEYFNDFEPGETREFTIRVKLEDDELDRDGDFEKCAVNKASVYWGDEFEGSDTAIVCWSNEEKDLKELPKTGSVTGLSILGFALLTAGTVIKKGKKSLS